MGSIGLPEILLILAVIVLIFGTTKIPQLGRGLGEGIRNFREAIRKDDGADDGDDTPK